MLDIAPNMIKPTVEGFHNKFLEYSPGVGTMLDFEAFMGGILVEWEKNVYDETSHSATSKQERSNEVIGPSMTTNTPDLIMLSDDED